MLNTSHCQRKWLIENFFCAVSGYAFEHIFLGKILSFKKDY